jgi:hypothetical protein
MLSRPILFDCSGSESVTCSASITSVPKGFDTFSKFPNGRGAVLDVVKTVLPSCNPVKV